MCSNDRNTAETAFGTFLSKNSMAIKNPWLGMCRERVSAYHTIYSHCSGCAQGGEEGDGYTMAGELGAGKCPDGNFYDGSVMKLWP